MSESTFVPASGGPKLVIVMVSRTRFTSESSSLIDIHLDLPRNPNALDPFLLAQGVSGCGKSTTGQNLARALGAQFSDGDDLHPKSNVEKMSRGEPLTDADRAPWLKTIRQRGTELAQNGNGQAVVACSSLRKAYRDVLRGKPVNLLKEGEVVHTKGETPEGEVEEVVANTSPPVKTYFVFIQGTREVLLERMQNRKGHFMKASMLDSQLATLESPVGEDGVVVVDLEASPERQCEQALEGLRAAGY